MRWATVLAAMIAMGIGVEAMAQQRLEGVKVVRDLDYGGKSNPRQLLDLYLPEQMADKPLPVIVWIHGGAWLGGSKAGNPAARFARQGYASASINYRLSQEAKFPAQIHDCKAAIRYLRANAKQHNLDPARIAVWGSSAGGHLVALLGTSGNVKELEGDVGGNLDQSSAVQAVVDWFGPTDLTMMGKQATADSTMDHDSPKSPESLLIGGAVQENKEKAARANPITYVVDGRAYPPFLIMHGDKDNLVPHGQSELLHAALKRVGAEVTFRTVEGAGHGGPGFNSPENRKLVDEFIEKHMKPVR